MNKPVWEFACSVEANAAAEFAWNFWTDVANWRLLEPGVEFELHGPFAAGTQGFTKMPDRGAQPWTIREVEPGHSYTQEIPLPGAAMLVGMKFEVLPQNRTRITQHLSLEGESAGAFLEAAQMFEKTTPDGLKRIAAIIENRASRPGSQPSGASA